MEKETLRIVVQALRVCLLCAHDRRAGIAAPAAIAAVAIVVVMLL